MVADPLRFALAKMLGFFVVTQLASRHGIKVQLRHSWYGGITALVLLPRHLVVNADGLAPPPGGEAERSQESSVDPVLDWIDGRVPMVHVPLRRPQGPVQPGPVHGLPGISI